MSDRMRPLPDVDDPQNAPFWAGTQRNELRMQKCLVCGYVRWPPGPLCPECQSPDSDWTPVEPRGTLYSYATYHRAFDSAFAAVIPYTVALIELSSGPRMYGMLVSEPADALIDSPVEAVFVRVTDRVTFVHWKSADDD
jgi:uncharacterized protein